MTKKPEYEIVRRGMRKVIELDGSRELPRIAGGNVVGQRELDRCIASWGPPCSVNYLLRVIQLWGKPIIQPTANLGYFDVKTHDAIISHDLDGPDYGISIQGTTCKRLIVLGSRLRNIGPKYPVWMANFMDAEFWDVHAHQAPDSIEHCVRIYGSGLTWNGGAIDSRQGGKSAAWLVNVNDVTFNDVEFIGGETRIGARKEEWADDGQGVTQAKRVVFNRCEFTRTRGSMPNVALWSRESDATFNYCEFRGASRPLDVELSSNKATFRGGTHNGRAIQISDIGGKTDKVVIG